MNVLTIVGNGFDLSHNLPTRFDDFIASNRNLYEGNYRQFRDEHGSWNGVEKRYEQLLCHTISTRSWVDVTEETERIMKEYGLNKYGEVDYYNYELVAWDGEIEMIARFVDKLNRFERDFQDYLRTFCCNEIIKCKRLYYGAADILNQSSMIINFNYTHTIEVLYGIDDVVHIHGDVDDTIAIGSGALENAKQSMIDSEYPTIKKFTPDKYGFAEMMTYYNEDMEGNIVEDHFKKRFFDEVTAAANEKEDEAFSLLDKKSKDTLFLRQQTIEELKLRHYDVVNIIGHSLGTADYPVFDAINKDASVMCYYYDRKDRENKESILNDLGLNHRLMQDTELYHT